MRTSILFFVRNLFKIDIIAMSALVFLTSLTVLGLPLEPGQRLFIDNEPFIIGTKLGEGASADVYHLQSELYPNKHYVMRSPIIGNNDSEANAKDRVEKFLTSLKGFNLIKSNDPDRTKWRWSPRVVNVPLNPHRKIHTYERQLGWDKTHLEPVVIIPLAKGTLTEITTSTPNINSEDRLRLAKSVYTNLIPELKHLISANLVHGDIKPDNILIDHFGNAGLNDFEGVIKNGEITNRITNNFYAPELVVSNGHLTYSADLYSTAKTLLWILMDDATWKRRGVTWTGLQTSIQYGVIRNELDRIRNIAIEKNIKEHDSIVKMIDFVRYALHPDPIQRILQVRKYVPEFKDLKVPKERTVLKMLFRQSSLLKAKALTGTILSIFSGDFFSKPSPIQTTDSERLSQIKELFLKSGLTAESLESLKQIPLNQLELQTLSTHLSSVNVNYRAWAALRLIVSGTLNEHTLDVFLSESTPYLDKSLTEKIIPAETFKHLDVRHLLQLLHEQIQKKGKTEGILEVISTLDLNTVLNSTNAFSLMKQMDANTIRYFSKFLVKQKIDLERLTNFLVNLCLEGNGSALLENLPELAKFITPDQRDMLLVAATKNNPHSSTDSQRVLTQLSKLGYSSETIENYLKGNKQSYELPEALGLYRYRQTKKLSNGACYEFYAQ